MAATQKAPAKINLALHVTGQREDGYHLIDTLVTFSHSGDVINVEADKQDRFSMSGRFATGLSKESDGTDGNLVLKARDALRAALNDAGFDAPPVYIHLEKNLPVASGIGGGSADAAAAIRALLRHWDCELSAVNLDALSLKLGADIPMCLTGKPLRASGIGENVTLLAGMPSFFCVLANPLQAVSTPQVFRALENKTHPPIGPSPVLTSMEDWLGWISGLRNDLEPPARSQAVRIAQLSGLLQDSGAKIVRMSGSGASCFGLYESADQADSAVEKLQATRPDWYFMRTDTVTASGENHGRP